MGTTPRSGIDVNLLIEHEVIRTPTIPGLALLLLLEVLAYVRSRLREVHPAVLEGGYGRLLGWPCCLARIAPLASEAGGQTVYGV